MLLSNCSTIGRRATYIKPLSLMHDTIPSLVDLNLRSQLFGKPASDNAGSVYVLQGVDGPGVGIPEKV